MLTRREAVIEKPFRDRRYKNHRRKVKSALPRIDSCAPPKFLHLDVKLKKLRIEEDRQVQICNDNIRLVHRLAVIMRTKRMDDINTSPKGPFEEKASVKSLKRKGRRKSEGNLYKETESLLETLTKEASKRKPQISHPKMTEHRAPHGYCNVPKLGFGSPKSQRKVQTKNNFDVKNKQLNITSNHKCEFKNTLYQEQNPKGQVSSKSRQSRPKTAKVKPNKPGKFIQSQNLKSPKEEGISSEAEGGSTLSEESFSKVPTTTSNTTTTENYSPKNLDTETKSSNVEEKSKRFNKRQSKSFEVTESNTEEYRSDIEHGLNDTIDFEPGHLNDSQDEASFKDFQQIKPKREDSDEQVSSVLLGHNTPNITIDEP